MKTVLVILILLGTVCAEIFLQEYARSLIHPIGLVQTPERGILIAEQIGVISNQDRSFVIDLSDRVYITNFDFDEKGLLSITYGKNKLYAAYDTLKDGKEILRISTFSLKDSKEKTILEIPQEGDSNKACHLFFDIFNSDFLYISVGDNLQGDQAQDLTSFLGKLLRIDVSEFPYKIPSDNPFVKKEGAKKEIYAYGLRNPWRCTQNEKYGLICGDPGTEHIEEINVIQKGGNYGWNLTEGLLCFIDDCEQLDLVPPLAYYETPEGGSVIGGVVPERYEGLEGVYLFADFAEGLQTYNFREKTFSDIVFEVKGGGDVKNSTQIPFVFSFAEDGRSNVYILTSNIGLNKKTGIVYRMDGGLKKTEESFAPKFGPSLWSVGALISAALFFIT